MAQKLTGSICLSKIDKSKITKGKDGKLYANIIVWLNDELDKYGNSASIQLQSSKDEIEAGEKTIYVGNLKPRQNNVKNNVHNPVQNNSQDSDGLPF